MKKIILIILDGVGIGKNKKGNALKMASMPYFNMMLKKYPNSLLEASGPSVGLPIGQMGNSEVGHLNIGAGRIVYQPLQLINKAIEDKTFFDNENILKAIEHSKNNKSNLHLIGLLSDGGVHSHINHFKALIELSKKEKVENLYIHAITDGRDTLPTSSPKYIKELEKIIKKNNIGKIASISGRYYAMDRDNNMDRTIKYYDAIVNGIGHYNNIQNTINQKNQTDEFIEPTIINANGTIKDNDSIIWVNFRPDRAKQILSCLTNKEYKPEIDRITRLNLFLTTMLDVPKPVIYNNAFRLERLENTLGEYIEKHNLKQLRIAETEKYAHVTYFFDGGVEKNLHNCKRILIDSPKVATYDLKPEMSANEITEVLLPIMGNYDLIVLNFANGDMVGHTGDLGATIKACETLDKNLGLILSACIENNITMLLTADHGNCEYMLDKRNNKITAHTLNKVPFIITNKSYKVKDGKLGDIAPTILELMNLEIPKEMTGKSLIK